MATSPRSHLSPLNFSKFRGEIAKILKVESFIETFIVTESTFFKSTLALRYFEKVSCHHGIKKSPSPVFEFILATVIFLSLFLVPAPPLSLHP
jgi:ribosomal protein S8